MSWCRTFVQVVALWGVGILMSPAPALAAAPLCSGLFQIDSVDIGEAIKVLAPLKMQIDLSHSQGTGQDMASKVLANEFARRWDEILKISSHSPESLKNMLRERILHLQKLESAKENTEQAQRKVEHEAMEAYLPQARKSVVLSFELREHKLSRNPRMVFVEHFDDNGWLLFSDRQGQLMKSEKGSSFALTVSSVKGAFGRIPDRNEVLHVNDAGKVWILSSEGKVTRVLGEIPVDRLTKLKNTLGESNIVVNSSGDKFALMGNNDVIFFDMNSKQSWSLSDKKANLDGPIQKVIFDNNSEAMVYTLNSERNLNLLLVDLNKKDIDVVEPIEMLNEVIARVQKNETIYLTDEMNSTGGRYFQVSSFSTKTNFTKDLFKIPNPLPYIPYVQAQEIPNSNLILVNRFWKGQNNLEIYDILRQKAVYQFEEINLPPATTGVKLDIVGVTFSRDHSHAFILYREESTLNGQVVQTYKLDQWALPDFASDI